MHLSVEYTPVEGMDVWEEAIYKKRWNVMYMKSYLAEPLAGWLAGKGCGRILYITWWSLVDLYME